MKVIYIADDGEKFDDEASCRIHENFRKSGMEARQKYNNACRRIQDLKSPWGTTMEYVAPTIKNVEACRTLPRIESICKTARVVYMNALNEPGRADKFEKISKILDATKVFHAALLKRTELKEDLRAERKIANDAYNQIKSLKQSELLECSNHKVED